MIDRILCSIGFHDYVEQVYMLEKCSRCNSYFFHNLMGRKRVDQHFIDIHTEYMRLFEKDHRNRDIARLMDGSLGIRGFDTSFIDVTKGKA